MELNSFIKMKSDATVPVSTASFSPPYVQDRFNLTPPQQHKPNTEDNSTVLDLSKNNRSSDIEKSPSPTHSTSSFATSTSSIHYISPYDTMSISSSPHKEAALNYSFFPEPGMLLSPGAVFAMYCRSIREQKFTYVPHIRDFIDTVVGPHTPPDQLDKLAEQIMSTYSLPPSHPDQKIQRPFKGLPRDPEQIPARFAACDLLKPNPYQQVEGFMEYRKRALEKIRDANGGHRTTTNPKMRRTNRTGQNGQISDDCRSDSGDRSGDSHENDPSSPASSDQGEVKSEGSNNDKPTTTTTAENGILKDAAYYERRRKNNAAAKKSRDRRRLKEDELTIRNRFLETQSIELHSKLDTLALELEALKAREVKLLCERAAFESREAELRRSFEVREAEILQQLKAVQMRNEVLTAKNDEIIYRLHARGDGLIHLDSFQ